MLVKINISFYSEVVNIPFDNSKSCFQWIWLGVSTKVGVVILKQPKNLLIFAVGGTDEGYQSSEIRISNVVCRY